MNGDGFDDVLAGARRFDGGLVDEGAAFVFLGAAAGPALAPDWTIEGEQAGAQLGAAVACAGDVDGDGFADVLVGAPLYDGGQSDEGRALVYRGSAGGLALVPAWSAESDQTGGEFGRALGGAGDVNGDGRSDVIVGAALFDGGASDEGRAFVYLGTSTGLDAAWTTESDEALAELGRAVAGAGDVDGDGSRTAWFSRAGNCITEAKLRR